MDSTKSLLQTDQAQQPGNPTTDTSAEPLRHEMTVKPLSAIVIAESDTPRVPHVIQQTSPDEELSKIDSSPAIRIMAATQSGNDQQPLLETVPFRPYRKIVILSISVVIGIIALLSVAYLS